VVLVHGGFVDGSGWQGVYSLLRKGGYTVAVVQNPTLSLEGDAAATKRIIDAQSEPVILVGHSYGGAVITEAGNDPKVAALVYIAAFAPDKDESVNTLIADPPPGAPVPPILPPQDGFLFLDREKFHDSFAADVSAEEAAFMADSQVPWGSTPWVAPSASLRGGPSRAGTSLRPKTGGSPRQPSRRCLRERGRPLSRSRPAIRSMCRSQPPWRHLSNRPLPKRDRPRAKARQHRLFPTNVQMTRPGFALQGIDENPTGRKRLPLSTGPAGPTAAEGRHGPMRTPGPGRVACEAPPPGPGSAPPDAWEQ
jgi:pimeloyl-ACP methyl ester carboxylesterase